MMEYIITKGGPLIILVFIVAALEYYGMKQSIRNSIIDGLCIGIVFTCMRIAFEYYQLIDALIIIGIILFLVVIFYVIYHVYVEKALPKESIKGALIVGVVAAFADSVLTYFFDFLADLIFK